MNRRSARSTALETSFSITWSIGNLLNASEILLSPELVVAVSAADIVAEKKFNKFMKCYFYYKITKNLYISWLLKHKVISLS